jgi:hypothetical protein
VKPEWETDDTGKVKVHPVSAFHIAHTTMTAVVARIGYLSHSEAGETEETIQLVQTPHKALQLANDLAAAAEYVLGQTTPVTRN